MKSRQSPLIVFAFMGIVSFDMSDVMSREEKKSKILLVQGMYHLVIIFLNMILT